MMGKAAHTLRFATSLALAGRVFPFVIDVHDLHWLWDLLPECCIRLT